MEKLKHFNKALMITPVNFSDDLLNKGVQKNKGKSESGVSGAVQADSAVAFPQLAKSVGDVGDSGHMLDLVLSQALGTAKDANPTDFSSTKLSKVVLNSDIGSFLHTEYSPSSALPSSGKALSSGQNPASR